LCGHAARLGATDGSAGGITNLSQPAMSAALGKLRRHFKDELLERQGLNYVLTPLGAVLLEQVDETLRMARRTLDTQREFDAAHSDREFHVVMSDYAQTVLGRRLITLAAERAPQVRLRFENVGVRTIEDVESRLRSVDVLLVPTGFIEGYPTFELFRDRWVCVAWAGNDEIKDELTVEQLQEVRRITTFDTTRTFTFADKQLEILGTGRGSVVADGFVATPFLLTGTTCIALLPERLARRVQEAADLRVLPLPVDMPPLIEAAWWHPVNDGDPGHQWFRQLLRDAAARLSD
jgi:DNA-binding transcriptional LysR family regulator